MINNERRSNPTVDKPAHPSFSRKILRSIEGSFEFAFRVATDSSCGILSHTKVPHEHGDRSFAGMVNGNYHKSVVVWFIVALLAGMANLFVAPATREGTMRCNSCRIL